MSEGRRHKVGYARDKAGSQPAKEFLESNQIPNKDKARILHWIRYLCDNGHVGTNREIFKKLDGELWELKSYQARIAGFWHDGVFWLTHGWIKKQDRARKQQIDRGERIRQVHLERNSPRKGRK